MKIIKVFKLLGKLIKNLIDYECDTLSNVWHLFSLDSSLLSGLYSTLNLL